MRLVFMALAVGLWVPGPALAQDLVYIGPHPIDLEGHWDATAEPHEHGILATGIGPFGRIGSTHVFLADPIEWGWDGAVWTYRGSHPLPGGMEGYCRVNGDHRHAFAPEGRFRMTRSRVHVFTGALRGGLPMLRPSRPRPPSPIVVAPAIASAAPYWFLGCQFQLLPGGAGALLPTPVAGCRPQGPVAGSTRGRAVSGDRSSGRSRSWFDGNYSRIRGRDGVSRGRAGPGVSQRR